MVKTKNKTENAQVNFSPKMKERMASFSSGEDLKIPEKIIT